MILVPTRVCNMNSCNYCGVYKKDFENLYFKDENIDDVYKKISFLSSRLNDFDLRFFGGEPLLEFDVIRKIIIYFTQQTDRFRFIINTNALLLTEDILQFVKNNDVKLIISCNGDVLSHSKSRGISIKETLETYENIKKITSNNIDHQINIVVQNETAEHLEKNLCFIAHNLGGKTINLLPVNYKGWNKQGLMDFKNSLEKVQERMKKGELDICFVNKEINNEVSLFNSEFVIDSDGGIYPSMVILEGFFLKEKSKILVSRMTENLEVIQEDFLHWENDNHKIYSLFINKFLKSKFPNILENDNESSLLFHQFLMKI